MDYTTSIDNVVHSGSGHRMHSDSIAIPTAWSGNDANMVIWSLMEVLRLAGVGGTPFNPDDPASYTRFRDALTIVFAKLDSPAFTGSPQAPVPPPLDNTTRIATTSWYWNQIAAGVSSAGKIGGVNSPNLLFNGSGEFGLAGGWGLGGFVSAYTGGTAEGTYFANPASINSASYAGSDPIAMGPSIVLTLSGEIHAGGVIAGTAWFRVVFLNASGGVIGTSPSIVATSGTSWTFGSRTVTTPAGTASVYVQIGVEGSPPNVSSGGAAWRRLKLEKTSGPSLYSQEANFPRVALLDSFGSSLMQNGYQKLPSGLIIQWGAVTVPADSTRTYNFPLAYSAGCYSLVGSRGAPGSNASFNFSPISAAQFQAQNYGTGTEIASWISLGR